TDPELGPDGSRLDVVAPGTRAGSDYALDRVRSTRLRVDHLADAYAPPQTTHALRPQTGEPWTRLRPVRRDPMRLPSVLHIAAHPACSRDPDEDGFRKDVDVVPEDPAEWFDLDGDGVGDNADAFPNDPDESVDEDGDGFGANSGCDDTDADVSPRATET